MTNVDEAQKKHKEKLDELLSHHKKISIDGNQKSPPPLPRLKPQPPPTPLEQKQPPPLIIDKAFDEDKEETHKTIGHQGDRVEIISDGNVVITDADLGGLEPTNLLKKCPSCSLPNEIDAKFCEFCGSLLT